MELNSLKILVKWTDFNWFLEEVRMASKQKHSILAVIIKDPHLLLWNHKRAKYSELILIFLGKIVAYIKMEMEILLFSLSEMILILSNLNAWINKKKLFMAICLWLWLDLVQVGSLYTTTAIWTQIIILI